jgi:hypothetical protein
LARSRLRMDSMLSWVVIWDGSMSRGGDHCPKRWAI